MFGLYSVNYPEKFNLLSVSVDCNIRNLLVTCTSEFVYKNNTDKDAEALFSFPLEGTCVVYGFEAVIGDKKIVGVCKELEEAKNLYKVAKEAGQKAAIIERNCSMTDVFKCRIGNMPMSSEAKLTLKFAMELKLSLSKSENVNVDRFCLGLPLILRPRYTPEEYVGDSEVYHVTNKYKYKFEATILGTKEIKNVFSINHQLKLSLESSLHGKVILESDYDGTHDLDVNIDYEKMRVPSVLYEFGTKSTKFTGDRIDVAFYKTDVAMLNFLPEFEKVTETQNKTEIIIVVDRSGSMRGSNIQHAKECLLIFIKSLPTNCKFQIYGFGSTFNKVFPHPQLYDEQSLKRAMDYQRNMDADLGGTELMQPLKDLYNATLSNDYTRVVFLLTDGDVGNQDEVFTLVRKHSHSTRLFTVGIGDGVSTSLVQKVAESGNGKSVFVRESKTLSASVIELLDIALNCEQFSDCKINWVCPSGASVVMVPSIVSPIFSNYFLTIFCMINGLKEGDSIKCNLSGKVNDKPIHLSLNVSEKDGMSDDEFRVHRLLAKYKIDEMTREIEDGKDELKKSLIELSLNVNMVTNYTTFVAIDPDAPEHVLANETEPPPPQNYNSRAQCLRMAMPLSYSHETLGINSYGALGMDALMSLSPEKCIKTKGSPDIGQIFDSFEAYSHETLGINSFEAFGTMPSLGFKMKSKESKRMSGCEEDRGINEQKNVVDLVLCLADNQHITGSWSIDDNILHILGLDSVKVKQNKPESITDDVWMTIVVYQYLLVKLQSREKEWRLLAKKAKQWLGSSITDTVTLDKLMEQGRTVL